jgi:chemotaxis protein methyltransferase CheR
MSLLFDGGPRLDLSLFRDLRQRINAYAGMEFGNDARYLFERRLRDRLSALGLQDFRDYDHYLRYHPRAQQELEAAVDVLVTNETYLFREAYQLESFQEELLPALRERLQADGRRKLTLWSAGCSTGEEVYSLAILILESGLFEGWDVRVFGSDISRRVLALARRGEYADSSFRATPKRHEQHFTPGGRPGMRRVSPEVRALCHFGHLNLLDRGRAALIGRADAVFCRNVLIYFDASTRERVIQTFYERLLPGGYLLLGHSESLLQSSTAFELVHLKRDLVYRRPLLEDSP